MDSDTVIYAMLKRCHGLRIHGVGTHGQDARECILAMRITTPCIQGQDTCQTQGN
jgi:hypothetical protein